VPVSALLAPGVFGRPAVVTVPGGGIVYLSVRDRAVVADMLRHVAAIKAAHPDHGGSYAKLRKALAARRMFETSVRAEYDAIHIEPPIHLRTTPRALSAIATRAPAPGPRALLGQWGQATARTKGLASAKARGLRVDGPA
jgi:hypothetical protein